MARAFPLLGEPLAVDLVNTLVRADEGVTDLLDGDAALRAWLERHADVLPRADRPTHSVLSLHAVRELRDALRDLLGATVEGRAPDAAGLRVVNDAAGRAHPALERGDDGPVLRWHPLDRRDGTAELAAIARSGIDVVTGPDRDRLRRCEGPGCVLFFVATNPRRRWCSSQGCGNRVRVARHRHVAADA